MNKKVYEKIKAKTKVGGNHYYRFKGCISECFEPYLNTYSEEEEAKIVDILEGAVKINERVENLDYIVLSSSCHLFKNIKDSLKRCLSFSNRKPLADLHRVFRNVFRHYTKLLRKLLPFKLPSE